MKIYLIYQYSYYCIVVESGIYEQNLEGEFLASESDDTDSMSTPTDSPLKQRLGSLDLEPPPLFQTEKQKGKYKAL